MWRNVRILALPWSRTDHCTYVAKIYQLIFPSCFMLLWWDNSAWCVLLLWAFAAFTNDSFCMSGCLMWKETNKSSYSALHCSRTSGPWISGNVYPLRWSNNLYHFISISFAYFCIDTMKVGEYVFRIYQDFVYVMLGQFGAECEGMFVRFFKVEPIMCVCIRSKSTISCSSYGGTIRLWKILLRMPLLCSLICCKNRSYMHVCNKQWTRVQFHLSPLRNYGRTYPSSVPFIYVIVLQ